MRFRLAYVVELGMLATAGALLLSFSAPRLQDEQDRARAYTRDIEFEYLGWMLDASRWKAAASVAGIPGYLDRGSRLVVVSDYLQATQKIIRTEESINQVFSDATVVNKEQSTSLLRLQLDELNQKQNALAPLAEGVFQGQVSEAAADLGLATLGQAIPSVLYHSTDVPDVLVVSPRDQIRQEANISIQADLPLEQQVKLEQGVEGGLNASALVVPVGGVGVYPTMIMRTTDRRWLVSTVAHEWTHNYLQLRPLGTLYDQTPELRTMNETTADIVGAEIGDEVIRRFHSGHAAELRSDPALIALPGRYPDPGDADPPPFDFRTEMHTTRLTVDLLLASGRITEAEQYMERRRREFVDHGFYIRRLNQAYFAFYGAYADIPGGPAGKDPVGPAVRALRAQSGSLAKFVNRIAWMTSFEQLQAAVAQ